MRKECLNKGWKFYYGVDSLEGIEGKDVRAVNLPHTWNNLDGQDGGADYFRGSCVYTKEIQLKKKEGKEYYLEFLGVNSIADVFVNGEKVAHHEGGFSTFRANVTQNLANGLNLIAVIADNSANDRVYPQMADFTFFGGIYRSVYIIETNVSRFDLDYFGGPGVTITPVVNADGSATVKVNAYLTNTQEGQMVDVSVKLGEDEIVKDEKSAKDANFELKIEKPELWDGRAKPTLYTAVLTLKDSNCVLDERVVTFGIRSFAVDKDGFILNGRRYPLRGVSRHQDRLNMGWAITEKEHEEDMQLIAEMGANTIRLAHYQHAQHFYDLADKYGMVVWAEIPYISSHLPNGNDNAISQMTELIVQNYNHPSIMFWGVSNEISIGGERDEILELHHTLNDLCHSLDKTRLTTMANVTMLEPSSKLTEITDIMSYNHYFGWYVGDVAENAEWLDNFRKTYPDRPIGLSEYGCEAILTWHNSNPKQGDYSEEYQAIYHENMLKIFEERPYLWATHAWNMFDFGVDGRDEGGVKGRNNKGLVTYDRKTKKDSFFIYRAYWTTEPFVHITSKRYVKRPERETLVKVYSNMPSVTLFVDGKEFERKDGNKVFEFRVPLKKFGKTVVVAKSGDCEDEAKFKYVSKPAKGYAFVAEKKEVANWFEKDGVKYEFKYPEGKFSVKDKLSQIMANPEGEKLILSLVDRAVEEMRAQGKEMPITINKTMYKLAGGMSIERIAGMANGMITQELLYYVNEELNKISKN